MKKVKLRYAFIYGFAALSGSLLLYTSQNVQDAEERLQRLEVSVVQERQAIDVLEAEWAYLNSPSRLETLAVQYLDMSLPEQEQMTRPVSADAQGVELQPVSAPPSIIFDEGKKGGEAL